MIPEDLRRTIPNVRSVCILTGAGVSAESGVPTFRGNEGLWKKFRPEELANVQAFMRNPDLVWSWYTYRRELLARAKPNAAHVALAALESRVDRFLLVTQNVDGLHQLAGSRRVVELHGNIHRNHCMSCGKQVDGEPGGDVGRVPRCGACGGLVRPGVVWFGEQLPQRAFSEAEDAARHCELFIAVGTSAVVYPAASLPFTAKGHGAYVVEINPEPTDLTPHVDASLRFPATEGVPALVALFSHHPEAV